MCMQAALINFVMCQETHQYLTTPQPRSSRLPQSRAMQTYVTVDCQTLKYVTCSRYLPKSLK